MLKESLEKLDKDVMNLLTYSVKFVQPSIEFVSNNRGYKQQNKNQQTRTRTNEKKATFVSLGVSYSTDYDLRKKTSYSAHIPLLWLLTGDFRLAKGDVKRISFFHVNGRFVRYLNPFFATEAIPFFSSFTVECVS